MADCNHQWTQLSQYFSNYQITYVKIWLPLLPCIIFRQSSHFEIIRVNCNVHVVAHFCRLVILLLYKLLTNISPKTLCRNSSSVLSILKSKFRKPNHLLNWFLPILRLTKYAIVENGKLRGWWLGLKQTDIEDAMNKPDLKVELMVPFIHFPSL